MANDDVKPGAGERVTSVTGALLLLVLGLAFVGAVVIELRLGVAGGGAAASGGGTRADSPGAFWFFITAHAFTALMLIAAGARNLGVPLPVAPRPLVIGALSLGVLLGGWLALEFAVNILHLGSDLPDDPEKAWFVRGMGLLMLGVVGYFIWQFGISEILERLRPPPKDEDD